MPEAHIDRIDRMERMGRIDGYRIESVLGDPDGSGSGRVFEARDPAGRRVAFKLHSSGAGEAQAVAEMSLLGLRHPYLATCLDTGRWWGDGRIYTVTELVDGQPLGPRLTVAVDGLALACRLLGALGFLHDQGWLHRDLKPDNVWLETATGAPVLLDFGLACPIAEASTRALAGTPRAMAPELLQGSPATVASDLWAAGLLLTEALTGRSLFSTASDPETMLAEREGFAGFEPADIDAVGDPSLVALLQRLLHPDPSARPTDAHAALSALAASGSPVHAELYATNLDGRLSAAIAAHDPRRAALVEAVKDGAAWIDLFPEATTTVNGAMEIVMAAARSVPAPQGRLKARLAVAEGSTRAPGVQDLIGLVEALAELGPVVVAVGVQGAPAEAERDRGVVARQLAALRGVEIFDEPLPTADEAVAVLTDWIGEQPVLAERLAAAPPATRTELEGVLRSLVQVGAVSAGPEGAIVHERPLPASWPVTSEGDIELLVGDRDAELLGVLCLCSWPLSAEACQQVLGREVTESLAELRAGGLVRRERSQPHDVYEPADGRLRRLLVGRLEVGSDVRVALARLLAGGAEALDENRAAAMAEALGTEAPSTPDDGQLTSWILEAAEHLRRVGRLGRAVTLLRRGTLGTSAASPDLRRLYMDLIDVLIRGGAYDEALVAVDEARTRVPDDPAFGEREARVHLLRGHESEALAALEGFDLEAVPAEDAILALQTRSDAYKVLGRLEEAATDLREALRRQGDKPHRRTMMLLARTGLIEEKLGHYDEAVRKLEASIQMARKLGHDVLIGPALSNLGRIVRDRGEKRRGLALQEEAARQMEAAGNVVGMANAFNGIGVAWLSLGNIDTARRYLTRALELAERIGDESLAAVVHNNMAQALAAEGRGAEAEVSFDRSMSLRRERDDKRGQGIVALDRGRWRLRRGQLSEARADLELAREQLERVESVGLHLDADLLGAALALESGDLADSIELSRSVLKRAETSGQGPERLRALDLLARAGEGDLEHVDIDGEERGPWLADMLFTRAHLREQDGNVEAADQDYTQALTILGETPDGPVECRGLVRRVTADFVTLESALEVSSPDFAAVGRLLARVTRDTDRARVLADLHELEPPRRQLDALEERQVAMQHQGEDIKGLGRLAGRVRDLERLAEINKALNTEREAQRILDLIVDNAVDMTGAARGFLILFDGRAEEFRAARNIDESTIRNPEFQVSHSVARQVMKSKQAMLTANAIDDPRLAQAASISELKLLSILCVPLVSRDRGLGAIYLDHPQVVGRFNEHHLETVTSLAEQAAIALENARLSEGLRQTNEELHESQGEIARLNDALKSQLVEREAELEEVKESLDASRRALGLRYDYSNIVTHSGRMHEVLDVLERVIDTDYPVIIHGESGTGKELIARAVHFNGPRKQNNFVSLNCAAIPENLIESELFGSVRGAFTGADRDRKGLFDQADTGTLFLDEIGDMTLDVQKRLLRVLQEGEFLPVGAREVHRVDVRILAATHRDLKAMVSEGRFREDLFYRLAVAQIQLPALRDRPEDIAPLIAHFLEQNEVGPRSIEPEALVLLERQPWPGNVRELSNFVMNLLLFDREGGHISLELVRRILGPEAGHGDDGGVAVTEASSGEFLKARLEAFERAQVRQALDDAGGNKSEAARRLGVGVRTLYKMLSRLGLA